MAQQECTTGEAAAVHHFGPKPVKGWYKLDEQLLRDRDLSSLQFRILADLFHRESKGEPVASATKRAGMFGVGRDTLRENETRLQQSGYLLYEEQNGKCGVYLAAWPPIPPGHPRRSEFEAAFQQLKDAHLSENPTCVTGRKIRRLHVGKSTNHMAENPTGSAAHTNYSSKDPERHQQQPQTPAPPDGGLMLLGLPVGCSEPSSPKGPVPSAQAEQVDEWAALEEAYRKKIRGRYFETMAPRVKEVNRVIEDLRARWKHGEKLSVDEFADVCNSAKSAVKEQHGKLPVSATPLIDELANFCSERWEKIQEERRAAWEEHLGVVDQNAGWLFSSERKIADWLEQGDTEKAEDRQRMIAEFRARDFDPRYLKALDQLERRGGGRAQLLAYQRFRAFILEKEPLATGGASG